MSPCTPSGDTFFDNFNMDARAHYVTETGGMSDAAYGTVKALRSQACLFGADGAQWGDDDERAYTWAAIMHIFDFLFETEDAADLPPPAIGVGGSGRIAFPTPV